MRVHDAAFMSAIKTDEGLATTTFEGTVTDRPARYVSVFPRESRAVGRFTGPHSTLTNEYIVHSVGQTPEQAKWAREHMLEKVLDVTLVIDGWRNGRVRFVTSQPIAIDKDPSPPLFYTVDVLAFDSERLPT
jgi:hypothetical protein